ncbi:SCO family protein [Sphingobium cloacae]|nr:SCO family protein [Sphingobium cloacae]
MSVPQGNDAVEIVTMIRTSNPRLTLILTLVSIVALGIGVALWQVTSDRHTPMADAPLAGAKIGGSFRLIDQDGKSLSSDSFNGRYRLMYFGYTYCPDICPTDAKKMGQALRAFEGSDPERGARVQPIMITIDPERDTPAVMKQFVAAFHPRLIGLTGTPEQIKTVLSTFSIYGRRVGPAGSPNYLMDHSAIMYLMDRDGKPITFFARDATPEQIAADLAKYVA